MVDVYKQFEGDLPVPVIEEVKRQAEENKLTLFPLNLTKRSFSLPTNFTAPPSFSTVSSKVSASLE